MKRISILFIAAVFLAGSAFSAFAAEKLVVYTSMKESIIGSLKEAFVKKYPDIAMDYQSAGAGKLMLPSFIGALAWKMLLSPRAGYINRLWRDVTGAEDALFNIFSYAGIISIETMYLFPFVFIQVCGALERMDPTLEESARISGAGLFTITRKITLPLVLPSILSGALLIMLYSMAHFGTVAVLGIEVGIYNIPTLIYERIHESAGSFASIRTGTVLASVLVVTAGLIIWLQRKVLGSGKYQIIGGKSFRPMYSAIGPNTFRNGDNYFGNTTLAPASRGNLYNGMVPVGGALHKNGSRSTKAMGREAA